MVRYGKFFQFEAQADQQDSEKNGIATENPDQSNGAGSGTDKENQSEKNRNNAAQTEKPLTTDDLAQTDGGNDFKDAGNQGSGGNQENNRHQGGSWPDNSHEANRHPDKPLQQRKPPTPLHSSST